MELELFTQSLRCSTRNVFLLLVTLTAITPHSLFSSLSPTLSDSLCFQMEEGRVVIEAENYSGVAPGIGPLASFSWEVYTDSLASENKAVRVPNGGNGGWTGLELTGPRLDYSINFPSAGTYRLWVRASGPSEIDDSFHAGLNGIGYTNRSGTGMGNIVGDWNWTDEANGSQNINLVIHEPGKHILNIWMREDGVQLDKIIIAFNPARPRGQGPQQSPQVPCDVAPNQPPVSILNAVPTSGEAPLRVRFDASLSSDDLGIVTYTWSFGDGRTGEGDTLSHTYTQPGIYTAQLTVTDAEGLFDTQTTQITVVEPGDNSLCFVPSAGLVVMEAENYTATYPGTNGLDSLNWEAYPDTSASGGLAMRVPNGSGSFTGLDLNGPRLDYTINFGETGLYQLWVRTTAPDSAGDSFHAGLDGISYTNTSGDGMGNIIGNWIWADEANEGTKVEIFVESPGKHTLNIWMREDGVQVDKLMLALASPPPQGLGPSTSIQEACSDALSQAPIANFTATPEAGELPMEVFFDASLSADPDGEVTSFIWDLGNGIPASGRNFAYTFTQEGVYSVRLIVFDNNGLRDTAETQITVLPDASNGICYEEANGFLVMEAENFSRSIAGSEGLENHYWEVYDDNNASAQNAVRAVPINSGGYTGLNLNGPRLDYDLNIQTLGTYRIWVRASAASGLNDSFHAGVDGVGLTNQEGRGMSVNGPWAWTNQANNGRSVNVTFNAIGKHTFHLWMREDGVQVDKIILTQDSTLIPVGNGPNQTYLANCATNQEAPFQGPDVNAFPFGIAVPELEDSTQVELIVYPNPCIDEFFVEVQNRSRTFENIDLRLMDIMGREIFSQNQVRPNSKIQLGPHINKGLYTLRVIAEGAPYDILLHKH